MLLPGTSTPTLVLELHRWDVRALQFQTGPRRVTNVDDSASLCNIFVLDASRYHSMVTALCSKVDAEETVADVLDLRRKIELNMPGTRPHPSLCPVACTVCNQASVSSAYREFAKACTAVY